MPNEIHMDALRFFRILVFIKIVGSGLSSMRDSLITEGIR